MKTSTKATKIQIVTDMNSWYKDRNCCWQPTWFEIKDVNENTIVSEEYLFVSYNEKEDDAISIVP